MFTKVQLPYNNNNNNNNMRSLCINSTFFPRTSFRTFLPRAFHLDILSPQRIPNQAVGNNYKHITNSAPPTTISNYMEKGTLKDLI